MRAKTVGHMVEKVRELKLQGVDRIFITERLGVSGSTITNAMNKRRGHDRDSVSWCSQCSCHVFPPCPLCALKEFQRNRQDNDLNRPTAQLPNRISDDLRELLLTSVAEIGLQTRTVNKFQDRNILSVNDLLHTTKEELLSISNFAAGSLGHVYACLARLGFVRESKKAALK